MLNFRLNSEAELDKFIKHLKEKGFHTAKKGHLHLFHYTSDGTLKYHFIVKKIGAYPTRSNTYEVTFHIDTIVEKFHKVNTNEGVMRRTLQWLDLEKVGYEEGK